MSELVDLLSRLVAIDSVNPTLVPSGAGERAIAEFVLAWLDHAGAETHWLETAPGRPSVVGVFRGRGEGRSLMLDGHIDTVGHAGMDVPLEPRIEGDRLYGRGAYDMKGGVAAMLVAAERAARGGLAGDVLVACVADEEVASLGTAEVAAAFTADAAIVTEPTHLDLVVAHKGFAWFEVETAGRAAHGSRPDHGIDAIAHMGRVLVEIERLQEELRAGPAHPLLGTGSLHASTIQGGEGWSTYPSQCRLAVEWRSLPGEVAGAAEARLQQILTRLGDRDSAFAATLTAGLMRRPHEVDPSAAIVRALAASIAGETGAPPRLAGVSYWTDCALLSAAGIPTAMFGPTGDGAHAAVEWVDLPSVETAARVLERTIRGFCA